MLLQEDVSICGGSRTMPTTLLMVTMAMTLYVLRAGHWCPTSWAVGQSVGSQTPKVLPSQLHLLACIPLLFCTVRCLWGRTLLTHMVCVETLWWHRKEAVINWLHYHIFDIPVEVLWILSDMLFVRWITCSCLFIL